MEMTLVGLLLAVTKLFCSTLLNAHFLMFAAVLDRKDEPLEAFAAYGFSMVGGYRSPSEA
jgi:hypothetical protein